MGNITVTGQPQAIYPDGFQDSFIIKNNGPYSIYVDSDSSITTDSHAIPPTGVMAWDAQRPLWVLGTGDGDSQITITRNSTPAQFANNVDNVLLSTTYQLSYAGDVIECSAYESLEITAKNTGMQLYTGRRTMTDFYDLEVLWFDSAQNYLGVDHIQLPPAWGNALDDQLFSRVTVPVRGTYFLLNIDNSANTTTTLKVTGTTRLLAEQMVGGFYDTTCWGVQADVSYTAFRKSVTLDFNTGRVSYDVYLPNISNRIHLNYHGYAAGATNGSIAFLNALDPNVIYNAYVTTITTDNQDFDFWLPMYETIKMTFNPRSNAGVGVHANCHITWL